MNPDYDVSLDFLQKWSPGGPWVLTAVSLDKKSIQTLTFSDPIPTRKWLESQGKDRNIYFTVNPVLREKQKKPSREDIKSLAWLHVDIDPRAGEDIKTEQERALKILQGCETMGVPKPTVIVFSGGGYQGFWKILEPFEINGAEDKYEDAKRYNQQLEILFGADNCHNVDRIMRLPGTINRPDERKKKKGRVEALATLVEWNEDHIYPLEKFTPAPRVQAAAGSGLTPGGSKLVKVNENTPRLGSVDDLPDSVPSKCKVIIVQGTDPDEPNKHPSRSEWLHYVCCELIRCNLDDDTIYSVITDPDFGISSSVREKSDSHSYAVRQIVQAREKAIDPNLMKMNAKHAVIGDIGGKCRVISEVYDYALNRPKISRQAFSDFGNRYLAEKVQIGTNRDGDPIFKPLGRWWLEHKHRRYYETMVFLPGKEVPDAYNLWKGFACDAIPGNCTLFLNHIRTNICQEQDAYYEYLLGWMARTIQKPDSPGQVAVVMRGKMGTGKSFFAKIFGSLFGQHYMQVSDPKFLVGSFNAHLRDTVVLFGDEAFYAGDKKHESVLKTLITEDAITIEAKGVDAEAARNCIHLIMASNDQWVVPAGFEERRFFVLDIGEAAKQNNQYFGAIADEMKSGGREALLHHLMTYDLSDYDVRKVPHTKALQEQKMFTLDSSQEWWLNKLNDGQQVDGEDEWNENVPLNMLYLDYVEYARAVSSGRRLPKSTWAAFMRRAIPNLMRKQIIVDRGWDAAAPGAPAINKRAYHYTFEDLESCRKHWDKNFGGPYEWPQVDEVPPAMDAF